MAAFIIRRLTQLVPLLFGITLLTFGIINLIPGSPFNRYQLNPRMKPADIVNIRAKYHLDDPWPQRYVAWVSDLARGDLGISLLNNTPVRDRIFNVLPNTILLSATAFFAALLISIPIGIIAALKRNSVFDNVTTIGSVAAFAIPSVWLSLLLVIFFSVKFREWGLPFLPIGQMSDSRSGGGLLDRLEHLILPTVALALVQLASWTRYIRASMLEVIRQDFVRTAQAKGLRVRAVIMGHAFRNALLPLVTLMGLSLPDLFAGAFVVETVFAWNGIGRLAVQSATQNDYTMIMGITLMFAVLTILGNLLADVAYALLDPRIRYN